MITNIKNGWTHFTAETKKELLALAEQMKLHPLAKDALLLGNDVPKVDVYGDFVFVSLAFLGDNRQIRKLQLMIAKERVISYTERAEPIVEKIKEKLCHHPEHAWRPSFILYQFLNVVTFHFLQMIDDIANHIQTLEKQVFKTPFENDIGHSVYRWKVKIHQLRQIVEAQAEMMKSLDHPTFPYIEEEVRPYMQDITSRFSRIISALDMFKETLSSIFDLQLSLKSDHMNVIMKTLTLVSVIFIPMTFIAGVYGMNFEVMPELTWKYGYAYAWGLMAGIGISIAIYFKKKGWWGKS